MNTTAQNTELNNAAAVDTGAEHKTLEINKPEVPKRKSNKIERKDLTQEMLQAHLELRDDGYFYYKKATMLHAEGDFAGSIRAHDLYYSITLFGVLYSGKMLAHFYQTGEWVNATRGPRLDENGNPVAKATKEKKERAPRTAPVFTAEDIAKAKAEAAAKRAEKKQKAEAAAYTESKSDAEALEQDTPDEAAAESGNADF